VAEFVQPGERSADCIELRRHDKRDIKVFCTATHRREQWDARFDIGTDRGAQTGSASNNQPINSAFEEPAGEPSRSFVVRPGVRYKHRVTTTFCSFCEPIEELNHRQLAHLPAHDSQRHRLSRAEAASPLVRVVAQLFCRVADARYDFVLHVWTPR
jgi:hypothetical protein